MALFEKKKYTHISTLPSLLDAAAAFGTATAIRQKRDGIFQDVSYAKLCGDVRALGAALCQRLPHGARVLVLGGNSYEYVLCFLALASGPFVPVLQDATVSAEALAEVIGTADVKAVLHAPELEGAVTGVETRISFAALPTLLEEGRAALVAGSAPHEAAPEDTAAVFFTSGTTGKSKGVVLTHENLSAAAVAAAEGLSLGEGDTFLSVLPQSHAFECVWGLLAPLCAGAAVAIGEDLQHLTRNMQEVHPTHMVVLPMIAEAIYTKILKNIAKYGTAAEVRRAITVSDVAYPTSARQALKKRLLAKERARFGGALSTVVVVGGALSATAHKGLSQFGILAMQTYGMTECAGFVSLNADGGYHRGTAGHACPDSVLDIYSPNTEGVGEIRCRGKQVMAGYLDNPEKTENVLRNGWFYTGDLGFMDKKGNLHVVGRLQNSIEMSDGKRICPERLEAALSREDGVAEAFVMGVPNSEKGDYDIVALLRPALRETDAVDNAEDGQALARKMDEAVAAVNASLPLHAQIQYHTVQKNELPRTPSRQLDRAALSSMLLEIFKNEI